MKKLLNLLFVLISTFTIANAQEVNKEYEPKDTLQTKKAVAYYQGGEYPEYVQVFKAAIKTLSNYGWVEPIDLKRFKTSKELWTHLSTNIKSDYLEFRKDLFYSSDWDSEKRNVNIKKIQKRIKIKNDIDLVLAFGTWAGQDLSHNNIDKNTFVLSSNNPVGAKIIKSYKHSGYDYLHTNVDEKKFIKQISLFHKIFNFKKMGVVYHNSDAGKSYAALDDAKKMAKKHNFELLLCAVTPNQDKSKEKKDLIKCYKKLATLSDAIYLTLNPMYNEEDLKYFMTNINNKKIPTFYQGGSLAIENGALMGISNDDFKYIGEFHAKAIIKTLNGALIKDQSMFFEDPNILALNLKTAQTIEWDPSIDIIGITKELYHSDIVQKY
ncbi:MAG: ABC transporter substrate binding protein [Campylobacterota bacterium]|nr:ABC transporter substrate binding protein [Campylobacterota bacterium]